MAYKHVGYLDITYNKFLFPISYMSGNGKYFGEVGVIVYPEENLVEIAALPCVRMEVMRNLPYFLTISSALALLLLKTLTTLIKMVQAR